MAKLEDILLDFDRRLKYLEAQNRQRGSSSSPSGLPTHQTNKVLEPDESNASSSEGYVSNPPAPKVNPSIDKVSSQLDSSSMLAFIGIAFVILAGVFFIKMTIDSGWLTPIRQILLATGTGLAFFLIPQIISKAEREYGALLAGAGTTILHLTWMGAYFLHHILGANSALVCATLVGVLSLLANFDKGNRAYVLVAMAGTYLSAPIVGYSFNEFSVLSIFLIVWNISFSATALLFKRRDIMFIASYYAVFTVLLLSAKASGYDQQSDLLVLQMIQFVIFSVAMVSYSVYHDDPLSEDESVALLPLLLLFYFSTGHLISSMSPDFAPWFGVLIGLIVMAIYLFSQKVLKRELKSGSMLTVFASLAFVHSFYFQILEESLKPFAALIIGVVVLGVWKVSLKARTTFFWPLMIFLATFIYGAVLTIISVKSIDSMYLYNWGYGLLALVAAIGLISDNKSESRKTDHNAIILGFAHLQIMLGLYRFSQQISWSGALFVTLAWGMYACLVLGLAYWRKDKVIGNSALTVLVAVSLKAFFYDLSNTSNLIRVGSLFAEGLLLYFCGWIFRKMQMWKSEV